MQTTGKNRNTIDKFYTNPDVVKKYIDKFKPYIEDGDLIIEPSAGCGTWTIPLHMFNLIAFDIQPEGEGIQQMNFLDVDLYAFQSNLHFIGNPPFGRQSSLAKKFIKHICSCDKTKTIAFILPKSFKKESCKKIFLLDFHLKLSIDLDDDAFTLDGKDHNVPSIFQIWQKESTERLVVKDEISKYISFVKKEDNPDLSIRRVGVNTTKCDKEIDDKSVQSHYFVKVKEDIDVDSFLEKFNKLTFNDKDNTVGPKSISKPELIKTVNTIQF